MSDSREIPRSDAVASALATLIQARYPGRFDDEQTRQIQAQIRSLIDVAERLRAYPLSNGDEPAPIYQAIPWEK